ncbi:MAG TPA: restriction endonuclease subunit S, partial [Candidatus Avidesulfovibrio excrementigallinarum]|nr:restriction endonuclease subunit S [Candidatus Avidesulfovibrio excrementigallinarum]
NIQSLGSGSTVQGVSIDLLKKISIATPSLAEQQAIASVLSDMDAEIEELEARRDKVQNIKTGMMQELLTGRTRLVSTGATA